MVSWYPHSAVPRECGPLWFVSHTLVVLCGLAPLVISRALLSSHLVITRYLGHRLQRLAARSRSASLYVISTILS